MDFLQHAICYMLQEGGKNTKNTTFIGVVLLNNISQIHFVIIGSFFCRW